MDGLQTELSEIRQRVIETEKKRLFKIAKSKFATEKEQEVWVYRKLNAKYGQPKKEVEAIWFSFSNSFGKGKCLADIMNRNVGECAGF
jgi:hypothetical protein